MSIVLQQAAGAFVQDAAESSPGTAWELAGLLLSPASRPQMSPTMYSVLVFLKQATWCPQEPPYGNTVSAIS